eukprot:5570872-Lingulodinium_polyedra.AAC.1
MDQAGSPSPALRQQPFLNWARGRAGCFPACNIRGQRARARSARQLTRLPRTLATQVRGALD